MSTTVSVTGTRPMRKDWNRMRDAYYSCQRAGVDIPEDVQEFFDYGEPGKEGEPVSVPFREMSIFKCDVMEIKVKNIPSDVEVIRIITEY